MRIGRRFQLFLFGGVQFRAATTAVIFMAGGGAKGAVDGSQAEPRSVNRVTAHPVGGRVATIESWGTLGGMLEPVWVTQDMPTERTSIFSWTAPLKVLIIRHGLSVPMGLGAQYADTVQQITFNAATGKFDIT